MEYLFLVAIILWTMAFLMKAGILRILILRYEWFQKRIRKKPFTVDEDGLSNYYFYLFILSGLLVLIYQVVSKNDQLETLGTILFIIVIISNVIYLISTKRYLIFND
ncbi:MAG: hypothetical protein ACW99A_04700 [Candidatus Kariarchaeaceae archaeon]|jgi:hypothetical protein